MPRQFAWDLGARQNPGRSCTESGEDCFLFFYLTFRSDRTQELLHGLCPLGTGLVVVRMFCFGSAVQLIPASGTAVQVKKELKPIVEF